MPVRGPLKTQKQNLYLLNIQIDGTVTNSWIIIVLFSMVSEQTIY